MKALKYISLLIFVFTSNSIYSQIIKPSPDDTTISFKVYGACIQCKKRIESAVKGKGVRSANWDIDSKILSLTYNPLHGACQANV